MDCTEVEAHLPLFVGGDLETPLAVKVEAHLAACGGCGVRFEAAGRARSALLQLALLPELDGRSEELDLWPGVRALLVEEGLVGSPIQGGRVSPVGPAGPAWAAPVPGRVLSFARYFGGAAAAAMLTLLFWRPWVAESSLGRPEPTPGATVAAPLPAPRSSGTQGPRVSEAGFPGGLLHLTGGPALTGATPLLPRLPQLPHPASAATDNRGLRRAGPDDQLLRDRARVFPDGPTRIYPAHLRGQGGWSLASDVR